MKRWVLATGGSVWRSSITRCNTPRRSGTSANRTCSPSRECTAASSDAFTTTDAENSSAPDGQDVRRRGRTRPSRPTSLTSNRPPAMGDGNAERASPELVVHVLGQSQRGNLDLFDCCLHCQGLLQIPDPVEEPIHQRGSVLTRTFTICNSDPFLECAKIDGVGERVDDSASQIEGSVEDRAQDQCRLGGWVGGWRMIALRAASRELTARAISSSKVSPAERRRMRSPPTLRSVLTRAPAATAASRSLTARVKVLRTRAREDDCSDVVSTRFSRTSTRICNPRIATTAAASQNFTRQS